MPPDDDTEEDDDWVACERCGESMRLPERADSWDRNHPLCPKCWRVEQEEDDRQAWRREQVRHRALIRTGYTCVLLALLVCPAVFGLAGGAIGVYLILKGATRNGTAITVMSILVVFLASLVGLYLLSQRAQ